MNVLNGCVEFVSDNGCVSIVGVRVGGSLLKSIVINDSGDACFHAIGAEVELLFNESELFVGKSVCGCLCVGNEIPCRVESIDTGKVFTNLGINMDGNLVYSLVENQVFQSANIMLQDRVMVYIKMTDIFIQCPIQKVDND